MRRVRPLEALLLLSPLFLLPVGLSAMSGAGDEGFRYPSAPAHTERLVVVTPQQKSIQVEFEEGFRRYVFERDGIGVDVEWLVHGGGSTTLRWIEEQFAVRPDGIGVDVFFGGGVDPYETLKQKGLLERYDPPPEATEGVAEEVMGFPIMDPERRWFGSCLTGFGIMRNTRVFELIDGLSEVEVEDWEDLGDPRLRTWVGAADPRTSSSSHMCFEILLQAYGFERGMRVVRRIGANVRAFVKSSSEVPRLCAVGEVACGMTIDYYALAQIEKVGDVIRFELPRGHTVINADAAGILKGAPSPELARRFIDFLLSEDAARLWMLRRGEPGGPRRFELNRGAVRPDVYREVRDRTNVRENPFESEMRFRYDAELAKRRWTALNDLIGAVVIDTHRELREALAAVEAARGAARADAEERLYSNPIDEAGLDRAAARWGEAAFRERTRIEWTDRARRSYREARSIAEGSR